MLSIQVITLKLLNTIGCLLQGINIVVELKIGDAVVENNLFDSLRRYFDVLSVTGYVKQGEVDKLLILSDRNEELQAQYKELGLDEVIKFS